MAGPRARLRFKTRKPLVDVRKETLLSLLAVGGNIDAAFHLLADDVRDRAPNPRVIRFGIVSVAVNLRLHQIQQVGGTRQAAAVGGQDASGAAMHTSR